MKKEQEGLKYQKITNKITLLSAIFVLLHFGITSAVVAVLLSQSHPDLVSKIIKVSIPIAIVLAIVVAWLTRYLLKRDVHGGLIFLKWLAGKLSKGDYTFIVNQNRIKKDEFGEVITSFNEVIKSTRVLIDQVYAALSDLNDAIENLEENVDQSKSATDEILKSSEEIAKGATEQATMTEKGVEKAQELGDITDSSNELFQAISEISTNVSKHANEGTEQIKDLTEKVYQSETSMKSISEVINKTNQSAIDIKAASDIISSIAEQTNLLALNAAIEASRAGESGKGFAVVADEIRTLAERSTESTKTIDTIIKELQSNSNNAINEVEVTSNVIEEQVQSVDITKSKFEEIKEAINENSLAVSSLLESGKTMNNLKEEVLSIMENLSAIAEENAASTEESIAGIEEQTASMENLLGEIEHISELNDKLNSAVRVFKTKKGKKKTATA